MALSGLRYKRYGSDAPKETKSGSYIFSGNVQDFHEWEFRTQLRLKGMSKPEDLPFIVQKTVEGLRGDAFLIAKDIGLDELAATGGKGIEKLIDLVRDHTFPLREEEAKELFAQGQRQGGPLSRQSGESMTSYLSRRTRWWKTLKVLDPSMDISESMRTSAWH